MPVFSTSILNIFDCRLNWKEHIDRKRTKIDLKTKEINWLIGKISHLSIENKLLIYSSNQTDTELRNRTVGYARKSNIFIMQRSQSRILRTITNAPRYVKNHTLRTDLNIHYVSDVIHERSNKHHNNLEVQPSPLLQSLLQPANTRRRKRCWPLDLQGT